MNRATLKNKTLCIAFSFILAVGLLPANALAFTDAAGGTPSDDQARSQQEEQEHSLFFQGADSSEGLLGTNEDGPTLSAQTNELQPGETKTVSRDEVRVSFDNGGTENVVILADAGLYAMQINGARGGDGGDNTGGSGGSGGRASVVAPFSSQSLYVVTGGQGERETEHYVATNGGANGGGNGGAGNYFNKYYGAGGGGGGATHIATSGGALESFLSEEGVAASVLLVAGGGGGGGAIQAGGNGGGATGGSGKRYASRSSLVDVDGGGQNVSGSGVIGRGTAGANGSRNTSGAAEGRGGGGGGYYGGAAITSNGQWTKASGAGGSGYLNNNFIQGTKSSAGDTITLNGATIASTTAGGNNAAGNAIIRYLASIVTLQPGENTTESGTPAVYAAPQENAYYTSYSVDGLTNAATSITTPTRPDAQFLGYYTQPDGAGTCYIDENGTILNELYAQGTTTLYAKWGCKVAFDANGMELAPGTSIPETQIVEVGATAVKPADPQADGVSFKGWSTDKNRYTAFDFSTPISRNETLTLYAFWIPYVEFDMRGHGEQIDTQFPRHNAPATKPTNPTATGYTFECWCSDPGLEHEFDFDTPITTDTMLYAKWSANRYTVEFYEEGELKGTQDFVYDEDAKPLLSAEDMGVSREGWSFAGWRDGSALQVDFTDGQKVQNLSTETGQFPLRAVWVRDIAFVSGVESTPTQKANALSAQANDTTASTVEVEQLAGDEEYGAITAPTLSTLEGWSPVGWLSSTVAASSADASSGAAFVPQATTFYGLYSRDVSLIFDGNEADDGYVEPLSDMQRLNASGDLTQMTFILPANGFTREGWAFTWWDLGAPGQALNLKPAIDESPQIIVRAHWEALDPDRTTTRSALANTGDPLIPLQSALLLSVLLAGLLLLTARARRKD